MPEEQVMNRPFFILFSMAFGVVFFIILSIMLFADKLAYSCKREFVLSNGTIFFIAVFLLLISILFYCGFKNKYPHLLKDRIKINIDKIVLATVIILFFGQIYVCYNIFFLSRWDVRAIRIFIETVQSNGNREFVNTYYSSYPNNLFISYLFLFLYKVNNSLGIFSGEYKFMCIVVLNCVLNSFSCWLSYKTAKAFLSPVFSLLAYVFCVFSVGISGWTVVCYSDALALFIPILSVYLYCRKYKSRRTKTFGFIMSGCVSMLGYYIKPQCLFALIAILVLETFKVIEKHSWKSLIRPIALCLSAIVIFVGVKSFLNVLNQRYDIDIDREQAFGYSHFLMMGANDEEGNGVYSAQDVAFSRSFPTVQERKKANLEVFKKRISDKNFSISTHLKKKMLTTFNDGTFAWGYEGGFLEIVPENINSKMAPFLKSIYHFGDRFKYFATFQQFIWMLILFYAILSVLSKRTKVNGYNLSLIWIILLGFVLYEVLFEVRARYLYIFIPLFCVLAPIGIKNICLAAFEHMSRMKNKFTKKEVKQ